MRPSLYRSQKLICGFRARAKRAGRSLIQIAGSAGGNAVMLVSGIPIARRTGAGEAAFRNTESRKRSTHGRGIFSSMIPEHRRTASDSGKSRVADIDYRREHALYSTRFDAEKGSFIAQPSDHGKS